MTRRCSPPNSTSPSARKPLDCSQRASSAMPCCNCACDRGCQSRSMSDCGVRYGKPLSACHASEPNTRSSMLHIALPRHPVRPVRAATRQAHGPAHRRAAMAAVYRAMSCDGNAERDAALALRGRQRQTDCDRCPAIVSGIPSSATDWRATTKGRSAASHAATCACNASSVICAATAARHSGRIHTRCVSDAMML